MALPAYPQSLPLPLQSSYKETYSPAVLRTSFADGSARQRVMVHNATDKEVSITLQLDETQLPVFETFYISNLKYGCVWFNMPLPDGNTNITKTVRIKNGKYDKSLLFRNGSHTVWKITMTLDMRL